MVAIATLIRGTVIHSASRTELSVLSNAVLGVTASGHVAFLEDGHTEELGASLLLRGDGGSVPLAGVTVKALPPKAFLVPGMVDTHTHAPQFAFAGTGYDLQLLDWLETYTFPSEAKFADLNYAAQVCGNAVKRTLRSGSTSCIYFGTIHTDAAVLLGRTAAAMGQRSFVGKVNMDRNAPDFYRETTAESIAETKRWVEAVKADADGAPTLGPAPRAVITPRFVPTCTSELMTALAGIADAGQLLVQSHVSENVGEIAWVKELHPGEASYTAVYDTHGLLNARTILAHGVYLEAEERALMASRGATVAHCPMSNSMLRSGMLNVRRLLDEGVRVSLGTDVSGGASPSMLSAVREALKISNMVSVDSGGSTPLTYSEAFWLATVGGAQTLGVDHLTGELSAGAVCDAVVVDPEADGSPIDLYDGDTARDAFQKWLQLGDDRNTAAVYVQGKQVLG